MKKLGYLLCVLSVLFIIVSFTTSKQDNQKVTICHIPPGNPDNAHEITVSINAVQAHLNHGDRIGSCDCDN